MDSPFGVCPFPDVRPAIGKALQALALCRCQAADDPANHLFCHQRLPAIPYCATAALQRSSASTLLEAVISLLAESSLFCHLRPGMRPDTPACNGCSLIASHGPVVQVNRNGRVVRHPGLVISSDSRDCNTVAISPGIKDDRLKERLILKRRECHGPFCLHQRALAAAVTTRTDFQHIGLHYRQTALILCRVRVEAVQRPARLRFVEAAIGICRFHAVASQRIDGVRYRMAVHGVHRKAAAFPHAGSVLVCNPVYGVSADAVASLSHHSIMSSRAVLSKSGNALPRRDALVRIPRQARALKKYFSGTSTSKICDKSDSFATLGDSPMLSVKLSPSQAPSVSGDCSCVFPAPPPPPPKVEELKRLVVPRGQAFPAQFGSPLHR